MPNQTTLPKMLGEPLMKWILDEHKAKRLTLLILRDKLDEHAADLETRGVVARYAYYLVQHVFERAGTPVPE